MSVQYLYDSNGFLTGVYEGGGTHPDSTTVPPAFTPGMTPQFLNGAWVNQSLLPLLTPMQFYLAFQTNERLLLKALAASNTGLVRATAAAIQAGGSGFAVNDTVTLPAGMGQAAPVLTVNSVGTGGAITGITIKQAGGIAAPSGAVAQASTSGAGTGASFNLTTAAIPQDLIIAEFWATYQMAVSSNAHVDPNLTSIQGALAYLANPTAPTPAVIAAARIQPILNGVAQ